LTGENGAQLDTGTCATPIVYDINRDGHLDIMTGGGDGQGGGCVYKEEYAGLICWYPYDYTNYNDVAQLEDVGDNSAPGLADINGDRQFDVFAGNAAGQLFFYQSSHLNGDIDRNAKVDGGDWILLKLSFGLCKGAGAYNPGADLNSDNCVNASDQTILSGNFGDTY